jgi:DNA-binding response OmpR family regulator
MARRRILVIEDEATIATSVAARLGGEGFEVDIAEDGSSGVRRCQDFRPDLVILDVMLPGLDGLEVCRRIQRDRAVPVLMLTARDEESDVLVGLGVGADDYVTKPFSPRELVARVKALLRRADRSPDVPGEAVRLGDLELDPTTRVVRKDGQPRCISLGPSSIFWPRSLRHPARSEAENSSWRRCGGTGMASARAPSIPTSEPSVGSLARR